MPSGDRTTDPPAQAPSELPDGAPREIAGRYEVVEFLGRGGRKRVYRVRDREDGGRELAISIFETAGIGESARARARREAQAMERLGRHPRLASVLGSGEHDGAPFLVSEYMPGGDVGNVLAESESGKLEPERAIAIAIDICRALEHAHGHGIVHRDLKPANVWIDEEGRARLGDFGLAATERRSREAAEGTLIGTVAYLPPEQAIGRQVDAQADLYSLGALLYEMVTGRPPFTGADAVSIISQHVNATPAPPRRLTPELPPALDRLILQLLEKAPADRPQGAAGARAALEAIAADPDADVGEDEDEETFATLAGGAIVGRDAELETMRARGRRGGRRAGQRDAARRRARDRQDAGRRGARDACPRARGAGPLGALSRRASGRRRSGPGGRRFATSSATPIRSACAGSSAPAGPSWPGSSPRSPSCSAAPPSRPAPDDEHGRFRLFDAVSGFLAEASRSRPIVVVLDDLHWADASSLDLMRFVAQQLADTRLLVVGTYRDAELGQTQSVSTVLGEIAAADRAADDHAAPVSTRRASPS